MTASNNKYLIKFIKSCTKREAVARLLGWLIGPIYDNQELVEREEGIVYESDLVYADSLDDTLENTFWLLLDSHQRELDEAKAVNTPDDVKKKNVALEKCIEKIMKADIFFADIEYELAKGESSALIIDQEATKKSGIPHILLRSLDLWARSKYRISILDTLELKPSANSQSADSQQSCVLKIELSRTEVNDALVSLAENPSESPESQLADTINDANNVNQNKKNKQKMRAQEQAILAEIKKLGLDPMNLAKSKHGVRGVRSQIFESLKSHKDFKAKTAFKHAWQRLLHFGGIKYKE